METQLVNRYLRDNNRCRHGIYIVGWFFCDIWRQSRLTISDAKELYDSQAQRLSQNGVNIKAVVLNMALH
jgi:hypothetical protein